MVNVGKILSKFSIHRFKIKAATGNFTNQLASIPFSRLLELCTSELLLPFSMSNQSNSLFAFKSTDFIIDKNTAEAGCSDLAVSMRVSIATAVTSP